MPGMFVDTVQFDVIVLDTGTEVRCLGQAYDGMAILIPRQVVDEIDHPVLQATDAEAEQHMGHEWARVGGWQIGFLLL